MDWIIIALVAIGSFIAGLLVGRRNPGVANVAASLGNDAKAAAQSIEKKV